MQAQDTRVHAYTMKAIGGKPFTTSGFGNKFRDWCDEADLPHCSAHGIRKHASVIAAENGATEHQLRKL